MPAPTDAAANEMDAYLARFEPFERQSAGIKPSWLLPLRKAGLARFAELGFPTTRHEDWRFTNVAPIKALPFNPVLRPGADGLTPAQAGRLAFPQLAGDRLVFVDGHFSARLSSLQHHAPGVRITNLAAALAADLPVIQTHLARQAVMDDNPFVALNTAFFSDGAFIFVPAGQVVPAPIHLVFVTTGKETGASSHLRNLIIAERESQLTVIESYLSLGEAPGLTNPVTELVAGEGSVIEHCKFQDESLTAYHVGALALELGGHCDLISHSFALGGRLARTNIRTRLAAPGIECILNGLYLVKQDQLVDHHMVVDHAQPHGASHEYYNGILADHARGVFHGRILVRPKAQKTDAKQTNKNLLLSSDATIDTKPQLEIYADDVKCTHGATVGQLNPEYIFYLRSRGIGEEGARLMLMHGFAGEIIERVRCAPLREALDQLVWTRLEQTICPTT